MLLKSALNIINFSFIWRCFSVVSIIYKNNVVFHSTAAAWGLCAADHDNRVYSASGWRQLALLVYLGPGFLGDILTPRRSNKNFLICFSRVIFSLFFCLSADKLLLRKRQKRKKKWWWCVLKSFKMPGRSKGNNVRYLICHHHVMQNH